MIRTFEKIDLFIFNKFVNKTRCKLLDKVMPVATHMGDMGLIWICIILVLLMYNPTREQGAFAAITLLIATIVCNVIFKPIFKRDRPFEMEREEELLIRPPITYSFPSGHTTTSFAVASAMFYINMSLGIICLVIASMIGFSRMYLYVHYPSDVIGGILLGFICNIIALLILT